MGKLVCTVEMDKEKGVTVKVENAEGKITQTVVMDGTSITFKVQGNSETSTVVQKEDSITITCKDFKVDATGTLTLKSAKASSWASQDILKVESTKDMTLDSKAKFTQSSTQDASLSLSLVLGPRCSALWLSSRPPCQIWETTDRLLGQKMPVAGCL